jgi:hypothetical protein
MVQELRCGTSQEKPSYRLMRALLVHNPTAGTEGRDKGSIIDALQLADIRGDYVSTKDDLKRASKLARDVVIAAGGNGTIGHFHASGGPIYTDWHLACGQPPTTSLARNTGTPAELAEQWRARCIRFIWLKSLMAGTKLRREGFGVGLMPALPCSPGLRADRVNLPDGVPGYPDWKYDKIPAFRRFQFLTPAVSAMLAYSTQ